MFGQYCQNLKIVLLTAGPKVHCRFRQGRWPKPVVFQLVLEKRVSGLGVGEAECAGFAGILGKLNNFSKLVIRPVIGRFTKMLDAWVRGIPFNLDLSYRPCLGVKV